MPRPLVRKGKAYNVIHYDVWGNAEEGFEINSMWPSGQTVWIPDDAEESEIVRILKTENLLKPHVRASRILVEEIVEGFEIADAKDNEPLFGLQREDGED